MRISFRKTRRLIANVEKLFAFVDDVGFLKTLFAHKINLLLQAFKARSQLFHFRLKTLVVQSHKGKLVIAEAQTVDKRFHALHHPVLRLTRNLHFDKALRFAAHKARIVHHARRALNARDQHHHPNDQRRQNHGQHTDGRLHGIRYFLVFPHILHRFESFGVIHYRTLSQNLMVHYSTFMFRLQHKKSPTFVHQTAKGRTAVYFTRRTGQSPPQAFECFCTIYTCSPLPFCFPFSIPQKSALCLILLADT